MYDPTQIGAQVWEVDRGGEAPIRGGTVIAAYENPARVLVVTRTGWTSPRKGRPTPILDTVTLDVEALDPTMTDPADARMADRVTLARHILAVVGTSKSRTRDERDDTLVGWAAALWAPPMPTRWRDSVDDTMHALEACHAERLGALPGDMGHPHDLDLDDEVATAFAASIAGARRRDRMPTA